MATPSAPKPTIAQATTGGRRTRLAPSPTGALHLGNARTFLINWAMARQQGWEIVLRVDDLDGPRVKPQAAAQALDDLRWLGLDWDVGPVYQTHCLENYQEALRRLAMNRSIYPCRCARSQLQAASLSAPHEGEHELRYPGTCRPLAPNAAPSADWPAMSTGAEPAGWRFLADDEDVVFDDQLLGQQRFNVQRLVGDFLVSTKSGMPSYQLAVVVDDHHQQVTDVVRGDDLLSSTPRQLMLFRTLYGGPGPRYWHVPLVVGPDGRRLAKRHGDSRLLHYRDQGVRPDRIVGLIGYWSGISDSLQPLSSEDFRRQFSVANLPRRRVTFTPEDERWLCQ